LQIDNAVRIYSYYAPKQQAIQGSAAAKTAAKNDIKNEMTRELAIVSSSDPGAAIFIDSVINNLSGNGAS
jgi:hypothetical protein